MYSFLYKICAWLIRKLSGGLLIVLGGLIVTGAWLYIRETVDFDRIRTERVGELTGQRDQLQAVWQDLEAKVTGLQADISIQQQRAERAARVIATLRDLESWWDRLIGNPEQQKANAEQIVRMEALQAEASGRVAELRETLTRTVWERDGVALALRAAEERLQAEVTSESKIAYYARRGWERSRIYVFVALGLFFLGPSAAKLTLFYGVAPWLARSRPIRLAAEPTVAPDVGESRVSVETALWPGEVLRVKEAYLQSSDEGLTRKTRFLLDWRIPFTSIACGLIELVTLRNGVASGARQVTFSSSDDPHTELALLSVPEGSSLILRPRFLAGVVVPADQPLRIRPRWQLFRWQAWITLQFRFFEFHGPCRLLVAGTRGVRAERLVEREGQPAPARRTNQRATIAFTPSLDYRPVRAETFWGYYRGMNPLFDDLFSGPGVFVVQETVAAREEGQTGRFWADVWGGVLKVFGI